MKLGILRAENFSSYPAFHFDFSAKGAALIYGRTGSGKSSVMDLVCWTLFGCTAKGGAADEVRPWGVAEATESQLEVDGITVIRRRGKSSQNDLCWLEGHAGVPMRGKDLSETQKLLEKRLGVSSELFLTGAYFHEFSETGGFFMAKAKDRRAILERVSDLSLPVRIAEACVANKKTTKAKLTDNQAAFNRAHGKKEQLGSSILVYARQEKAWELEQARLIKDLEARSESFEESKEKEIAAIEEKEHEWEKTKGEHVDHLLDKLDLLEKDLVCKDTLAASMKVALSAAKCNKCGSLTKEGNAELMALKERSFKNDAAHKEFLSAKSDLARDSAAVNPYSAQVIQAEAAVNTYLDQIDREDAKVNPFIKAGADAVKDEKEAQRQCTQLAEEMAALEHRHACLVALYDLSFELRGVLLLKAVKEIEASTNAYLEDYFDAELRVEFSISGGDAIDVEIQKGGNVASFTQLSKGQRQLLKLCFPVSVMKAAANNSGVHFDNLFLDESLDGLDSALKVQAYRLFEELSSDHESVLVIDHSPELYNLFTKRYQVRMDEAGSEMIDESQD